MLDRLCTIVSAAVVLLTLLLVVGHMIPHAVKTAVHDARMYHHMSVGN